MERSLGIVGTAGHVDHGKTSLVKALTGMDTDRLAEEKKRGLTIETGFARLDFGDGSFCGIVDVPGHERFLGNMLACAGGIQVALLVVDCLEGVMPQTREHLEILSYLGVKEGVVALTKADLALGEETKRAGAQVEELLAGTFLEGAQVMPVSAWSGEGVEELRRALLHLLKKRTPVGRRLPFYLPVDRCFSRKGFGTIVTGTLSQGTVERGAEVMLYPQEKRFRVRSIQVHQRDRERAFGGERTALNLSGLSKDEVRRGDVLAPPGTLRRTFLADVRLELGIHGEQPLKNGSRVHLYHGARALVCRVVLFGKKELLPGETCMAQLRMEEETTTKAGERFVIRSYSPVRTIGGGVILDPAPPRHNRPEQRRETGREKDGRRGQQEKLRALLEELYRGAGPCPPLTREVKETWKKEEGFSQVFFSMTREGTLRRLDGERYIHREAWEKAKEALFSLEAQGKALTPANFRDALGISRKQSIALLEAFDRERVTCREGEVRRLLEAW
ncbi:MAG: selenocysteine-specific translation elongation factor [Eubacteriales bacterium]|nr:selenocysteine-specific translation elongation factor [Eubacteriales bacterium]